MIQVPFFLQELKTSCFPACLRMILAFYGTIVEEKKLRQLCNVSENRGGSWHDIRRAAESLGFKFEVKINSSIQELENLVKNGVPIIVSLDIFDLGWVRHQGHTIVILQMDDELVYHDPQRGAELKISKEKFITIWKKRDNRLGYIKSV